MTMTRNLLILRCSCCYLFWLFYFTGSALLTAQVSGNSINSAPLLQKVRSSNSDTGTPQKAGSILINGDVQNLSLADFNYNEGEGPSARQKFTVEATGLTGILIVKAPAYYEISSNATFDGNNTYPFDSVSFKPNKSNAVTKRNVHVRLRKDLPAGSYSGLITIGSSGSMDKTVQVTGTVAAARPRISVSGDSISIKNGQTKPNALNNTLFKTRKIGTFEDKQIVISNKGGAPLVIQNISIQGTDATQFSVPGLPALPFTIPANAEQFVTLRFAPTAEGVKRATVHIQSNDAEKNPFTFVIGGKAELCGITTDTIFASQGFEAEVPGWTYSLLKDSAYGPASGFASGKSAATDNPSNNNLFYKDKRSWRLQGNAAGAAGGPATLLFAPVNVTKGEELRLSMRVAAYSIGATDNGMDAMDLNGVPTTDDMSKADYFAVEVSPDGGTTWYPQFRLVSEEDNLVWGFRTAAAQTGTVAYQTSGAPVIIKATGENRYKHLVVTDLPATENLRMRILLRADHEFESWLVDEVQLSGLTRQENTWDGSSWSKGAPQADDLVRFAAPYTTVPAEHLQVCRCIMEAEVTVTTGSTMTVTDQLINNSQLIVESDGNFIQKNELSANSGTGSAMVKRDATMRRLDYVYWASPVAGQKLKDFSPATLNTRFYTYHEGTDLFETIDPLTHYFGDATAGAESPAKGYAIRAPNNYPSAATPMQAPLQTFTGVFKGRLNNGVLNFPLKYQSGAGGTGGGYNLVGNPYASNIDFYQLADTNAEVIHKKAYFWTNAHPTPEMQGSNYPGEGYTSNYVIMNGTGSVLLQGTGSTPTETITVQQTVKVGQGFIVKAKKEGMLQFSNSIRTAESAGIFFSKGNLSSPKDRFWLQLVTPLQVVVTTLLGYVPGATDGYDEDYDADLMGVGVDALFMNLADHKLGIQGRQYPLRKNDIIPLGTHHFVDGTYKMRIGAAEGVFANGQLIYLRDKNSGEIANLSEMPYEFTAAKGLSEGRFELLFEKPAVLATSDDAIRKDVQVYRDGPVWILRAPEPLDFVEIYDSSGKLVRKYTKPGKSLRLEKLATGMYILHYAYKGVSGSRKIRY